MVAVYAGVTKKVAAAKVRAVVTAEKVLLAELKKLAASEIKLVAAATKPKAKARKKKKK